jgi:hypothetical protein
MQIHLSTAGQQQGPFTLDQVNASIASGAIAPAATLAWYEGCAQWMPLSSIPGIITPAGPAGAPPPPLRYYQPGGPTGDATAGLIPYKNPHALTAYYLGIFSIIPTLGLVLSLPALILGIVGLKKRKANPIIKGAAHAWVGIGLGSFSLAYHLAIVGLIIFGADLH